MNNDNGDNNNNKINRNIMADFEKEKRLEQQAKNVADMEDDFFTATAGPYNTDKKKEECNGSSCTISGGRTNKRRTNKRRTNKRRTNKRRTNKRRTNKRRTNKRRSYKQKGGTKNHW
jgi:hypothetical protein